MTILFLCRYFYPHIGGVEKHVLEISQILKSQAKINIVTEQHDPKLPQFESFNGLNIYRIPLEGTSEKTKKFKIWIWFLRHLELIKQSDIIHIHDVFFWILPFRFLFSNNKFFITFHGYEGSKSPAIKQIIWHKIGEILTAGNMCIGEFHKKWYKTKPTIVSFGATTPTRNKKLTQRKKSAIFVGRLDQDTGIIEYVQAATQLSLHLDIYGDGPLFYNIKNIIKGNSRISLKGFVPDAQQYISKYQVAFISRYLGILEALIAKTPVIAHFNNDIKKDYLKLSPFNNFIYTANSSNEIVNAYNQILFSSDSSSMVEKGYNWVKKQTWNKLVLDYKKLWHI